MAQLIKASDIKVVTKDGECKLSISIDLNINLNTSGVTVGVQNAKVEQKKKKVQCGKFQILHKCQN